MLIVCPNCATSYMIEPTSLGAAGRSVRCARCKSTWFAAPKSPAAPPAVSAFVDGVIAEAEAESSAANSQALPPGTPPASTPSADADDFGQEPSGDFPPSSGPDSSPAPFEDASHNADLAPRADAGFDEQGEAGKQPAHDAAIDHDTVPADDAPSLVPPLGDEALSEGPSEVDMEEIESYAARRERMKARRQKSKRTSRWTAIILVLFAFNVALVGARSEVVRYLPQTASLFAAIGLPVNLRDLKFENVKITKDTTDGVSILVIEGTIVNTADKPTEVPRLRFAARNSTGQDVYTWTAQPARPILKPNESMPFHSRLAAPPSNARDVMVRFFTAQDAASRGK